MDTQTLEKKDERRRDTLPTGYISGLKAFNLNLRNA